MKKLLFAAFALLLFSCKNEVEDDFNLSFYYEVTHCSDAWQQNSTWDTEEQYQQVVKDYLNNDLGITFTDFVVESTNQDFFCEACNCVNGKIIRFKSPEANKAVLLNAGFKEE